MTRTSKAAKTKQVERAVPDTSVPLKLVRALHLPDDVQFSSDKNIWTRMTEMLSKNPNEWFELSRTYSSPHSPVAAARRNLPPGLNGDHIDSAYLVTPDGRYRVWLRYDPAIEQEEDE